MAEVPDGAAYQFVQYRLDVKALFFVRHSMAEHIEQIHKPAMIIIYLTDLHTQQFVPNQIFHKLFSR